jgi:hypothetical protein
MTVVVAVAELPAAVVDFVAAQAGLLVESQSEEEFQSKDYSPSFWCAWLFSKRVKYGPANLYMYLDIRMEPSI